MFDIKVFRIKRALDASGRKGKESSFQPLALPGFCLKGWWSTFCQRYSVREYIAHLFQTLPLPSRCQVFPTVNVLFICNDMFYQQSKHDDCWAFAKVECFFQKWHLSATTDSKYSTQCLRPCSCNHKNTNKTTCGTHEKKSQHKHTYQMNGSPLLAAPVNNFMVKLHKNR